MAVAKLDVIEQYLDNNGTLLNGGKVYHYAGGTTTPLAVYTTSVGNVAHDSPYLTLDSAGRPPGDGIWYTVGSAYKIVIATSADVVLDTIDNVTVASGGTATFTASYIVDCFYHAASPPAANELIGAHTFAVGATFPANFSSAGWGSINTAPTSSFVVIGRRGSTAYNNGTQVCTVTIGTNSAYAFATTAGASISFLTGENIKFYAPNTPDATANDFNFTTIGAVS